MTSYIGAGGREREVSAPVRSCWPGTLVQSGRQGAVASALNFAVDPRLRIWPQGNSVFCGHFLLVCLSLFLKCFFSVLPLGVSLPVSQCLKSMCFLSPQEKEAWNEVFGKALYNFMNLKMCHVWDSSTCRLKKVCNFCFQVFHFKVFRLIKFALWQSPTGI